MKIKEGYLLHEVAGNFVIVAFGQQSLNFNGIFTVSETGKCLWDLLIREEGATIDQLVAQLLEEYEVDQATAQKDVEEFIKQLFEKNLLDK